MPGYAPSYLWPPAAIPTGARCPRGRRSRTRPPAAPLPPCRARASPELRPPVLKAHLDRFGRRAPALHSHTEGIAGQSIQRAGAALPGTSQLVDGSPCRGGFRDYIGISMILSIAKLGLTCLKSNTEGMPPDSAASSLPTPFWCPEFRCRTVRRNPYKALLSRDYSAMER